MKTAEKIKMMFDKSKIEVSSAADRNILTDSFEALGKSENINLANEKSGLWRIIMNNNMFRYAAIAIVVLVVFTGVNFLTGDTNGNSAYAEVVKQFRKALTLSYTMTDNTETIQWQFKNPGLLRSSTDDGYITILDANKGKMLSLVPFDKTYITVDLSQMGEDNGTNPFAIIEKMRSFPENKYEVVGEKLIDGVKTKGYRIVEKDLTTTIWINLEIDQPVEIHMEYAKATEMNCVISKIKFDEPMADSLFDLSPPDDYKKISNYTLNAKNNKEADLIKFLKFWADSTTDKTFPPIVTGPQMARIIPDMFKEGKFSNMNWTKEDTQNIMKGGMFVATLPLDSNWRYVGQNVKFGDPTKAIFWYKIENSEIYRVIYADLNVRDVKESDLPE
ncbi:MAG: hypothetical protein JEZ07_08115 [Phycisphaerae bacterium]|nr:hypothetical protein [Phycisphaerae bacterium]